MALDGMAVAWLVVLVFIAVSSTLLIVYDWFIHRQARKDADASTREAKSDGTDEG